MIPNQLLCTFTNNEECESVINKIQITYEIIYHKIFILQNIKDDKDLMCTYNIDQNNINDINAILNTIVLHRKKQSNTLYTINALNELIKSLNNGVLDIKFSIDWDKYQNCMILINNNQLNIIKTKIKDIIFLKNSEN